MHIWEIEQYANDSGFYFVLNSNENLLKIIGMRHLESTVWRKREREEKIIIIKRGQIKLD